MKPYAVTYLVDRESVDETIRTARIGYWGYLERTSTPITIVDGSDNTVAPVPLTDEAIAKGLDAMITDYPHHFADMVSGRGDATTGDVLVQCIAFGTPLKYG